MLRAAAAVGGVFAAVVLAAGGSAEAAKSPCPGRGGKTVKKSGSITVFLPSISDDDGSRHLMACNRKTKKRIRLGVDRGRTLFAYRGDVMAVTGYSCVDAPGLELRCPAVTEVVNIATGKRARPVLRGDLNACLAATQRPDCGDVKSVVAGRDLRMAFIAAASPTLRHVAILDPNGNVRIIASGTTIGAKSLRVSADGGTIDWLEGSARKTAVFAAPPV